MRLVLIHGRGQAGKEPQDLQQEWEEALDQGFHNANLERPAGLEVQFPFYGDKLDELLQQLDTPLPADVVERGAPEDSQEVAFMAEFAEEVADGAGLTEDEKAEFYPTTRERGLFNMEWVHSVAQALDKIDVLGGMAMERFMRDVYVYLTNRPVQQRIHGLISTAVTGKTCVVVGHSLGSIVGYNLLLDHASPVVRYVTVGSPLGIKAVKNRLRTPLRMPKHTTGWYNAFDDRDPVALYPLDERNFGIRPAIVNNGDVRNFTNNRHSIAGYLSDAWVARAIHEALLN